jgi:uncharacterized repeat protein (TIGR03803 family)
MPSRRQHRGWMSGIWPRAAKAALGLAGGVIASGVHSSAQAQTLTVLHSFTGGSDGANPLGLVGDAAGNLYGLAYSGGDSNNGTVFEVDKTGKESTLYQFGFDSDGSRPVGALVRDAAGNLYGATQYGGFQNDAGTVFKVDKTGKETILYTFMAGSDGDEPLAGLVRDVQGSLYGTTWGGGTESLGNVFKVDKTGRETVLYSFDGGNDGSMPFASLILDEDGTLYGTTAFGGRGSAGVAFKLDKSGKVTVLHSFTGGLDGGLPKANLIKDGAGNLYGTTFLGGDLTCHAPYGCGLVFKLDRTGKEIVLHAFKGQADGANPVVGLIRDEKGNLYGATNGEADSRESDYGTVFKLNFAGKETVLYRFTGGADGAFPDAGLVRDAAGNLYGTTSLGGAHSWGTVFKLTP